jgi:phosphoribosylaminoimidazole-succinocarboxamide synthase
MRTLELPGTPKVNRGKVREIFAVEPDRLLIVATDRLSAFDVVLPGTIPHKGKVLTQISDFWFRKLEPLVPNHVLTADVTQFPEQLQPYAEELRGRSMLVHRCQPLPVECVVRGYLAGSGWKEYRETQSICGIPLPAGLREADELPQPIFTPATKATTGHDENIPLDRVVEILGTETAEALKNFSISIYDWARGYARERGIIICDTKFEFGFNGSRLILIDEVLTPDSSRFWPVDQYQPGKPQPSFDKQFVRDYLETLDWDKTPPGPELPAEIAEATSRRYLEAYERLTGKQLEV